MIIGQTLHGQSTEIAYYSPWYPARGNMAFFVFDMIMTTGLSAFKVTVQTKKSDGDDASATTLLADEAMTRTNNTTTNFAAGARLEGTTAGTGFEDVFRFVYELTSSAADTPGWAHFRILNPSWLTG